MSLKISVMVGVATFVLLCTCNADVIAVSTNAGDALRPHQLCFNTTLIL